MNNNQLTFDTLHKQVETLPLNELESRLNAIELHRYPEDQQERLHQLVLERFEGKYCAISIEGKTISMTRISTFFVNWNTLVERSTQIANACKKTAKKIYRLNLMTYLANPDQSIKAQFDQTGFPIIELRKYLLGEPVPMKKKTVDPLIKLARHYQLVELGKLCWQYYINHAKNYRKQLLECGLAIEDTELLKAALSPKGDLEGLLGFVKTNLTLIKKNGLLPLLIKALLPIKKMEDLTAIVNFAQDCNLKELPRSLPIETVAAFTYTGHIHDKKTLQKILKQHPHLSTVTLHHRAIPVTPYAHFGIDGLLRTIARELPDLPRCRFIGFESFGSPREIQQVKSDIEEPAQDKDAFAIYSIDPANKWVLSLRKDVFNKKIPQCALHEAPSEESLIAALQNSGHLLQLNLTNSQMITKRVIQTIGRSLKRLTSLTLNQAPSNSDFMPLADLSELEELNISTVSKDKVGFLLPLSKNAAQIRKLHLKIDGRPNEEQIEQVLEALRNWKHLEKLSIDCPKWYWGEKELNAISQHKRLQNLNATLVVFSNTVGHIQDKHSKLYHLGRLVLIGNRDQLISDLLENMPMLCSLELSNGSMPSDEMQTAIATTRPALQLTDGSQALHKAPRAFASEQ